MYTCTPLLGVAISNLVIKVLWNDGKACMECVVDMWVCVNMHSTSLRGYTM